MSHLLRVAEAVDTANIRSGHADRSGGRVGSRPKDGIGHTRAATRCRAGARVRARALPPRHDRGQIEKRVVAIVAALACERENMRRRLIRNIADKMGKSDAL